MKIKSLPFLLVILLLTPLVVAAQANPCASGASVNLGACISRIYIWSLGISGLLAVAMSVFGGYLIMSARGNGAQVSKGKSYIISSLIGMVLLMCAYLLLNTINPELVDFTTPKFE